MKTIRHLVLRSLAKKPVRAGALFTLILLLSFSVFAGALSVSGMKNGLSSLENRLGADAIVVPKSARSSEDLSKILLNGTTGYFYMDRSVLDKVRSVEGVEKAAPQLFLASLRADCCSAAIQVIGIDQESDFSIQPWIAQRYEGTLGEYEVVAGCQINAQVGERIRIYDRNCTVVAKLAKTGTGLDTAVYTSMDNIRLLLEAAQELGHDLKISGDPAEVISAVYVRVKEGYDVEKVSNDLKVYVRKTETIQTKNMLTGVSDGLSGIAKAATVFTVVLWLIGFAVLLAAFCLMINERKREFAVLRLLGMSRKKLAAMIRLEACLLSVCGSVCGIVLGFCVVYPFSNLIEMKLGMPFLPSGAAGALLTAVFTLVLMLISGMLAASYTAHRLSRVEPGTVLREGN
ncbi:MAG: FtsX-like permease family protein [Eubacteriales bacterium]|nr:FtsX-like permease family protein [Eubacteriales bacterium]